MISQFTILLKISI